MELSLSITPNAHSSLLVSLVPVAIARQPLRLGVVQLFTLLLMDSVRTLRYMS
ncbi:hypothetical protein D3C72_681410 [compost metagenome]